MKDKRPRLGFLEGLFTRQERTALTFFVGVGIAGLLLIGWRKAYPPAPPAFVELKVHVNAATAEELAALPGIGPTLAKRIVEDRRQHGCFLTLTDLSRVKGVTPKVLEKLQNHVQFD